MKPLIKYSGSKFPYLEEIEKVLPQNYENVFIPFCGGGSYLTLFKQKNIYASDILPDVINIFNCLKLHPTHLKDSYKDHYNKLVSHGQNYYYEVRDNYNKHRSANDFLWLTRTCFNGLIRFNPKNEFNVSFHHNRKGIEPQKFEKIVDEWNCLVNIFNQCRFICEDYRKTLCYVKARDFVILDPPYLQTKGQYQMQEFDFSEFEKELNLLTDKDVHWLVTMDDDLELVKKSFHNLRQARFYKTTKKSSSFSRLKMKNINKGNTIITNYDQHVLNPRNI